MCPCERPELCGRPSCHTPLTFKSGAACEDEFCQRRTLAFLNTLIGLGRPAPTIRSSPPALNIFCMPPWTQLAVHTTLLVCRFRSETFFTRSTTQRADWFASYTSPWEKLVDVSGAGTPKSGPCALSHDHDQPQALGFTIRWAHQALANGKDCLLHASCRKWQRAATALHELLKSTSFTLVRLSQTCS